MGFFCNSQTLQFGVGASFGTTIQFEEDGYRSDYNFHETYIYNSDNYKVDYQKNILNKYTPSFASSLCVEWDNGKKLSWGTGLLFMEKGFNRVTKYRQEEEYILGTDKDMHIYNVEEIRSQSIKHIDLSFYLKLAVIQFGELKLSVNGGILCGIGFSGKYYNKYYESVYHEHIGESPYTEEYVYLDQSGTIDFSNDKLRFNTGLSGGLNIEYSNYFIQANTSFAVANFEPIMGLIFMRKNYSIQAGYRLNLNKLSKPKQSME